MRYNSMQNKENFEILGMGFWEMLGFYLETSQKKIWKFDIED